MLRIGSRNHKAFFEMAQQGLFLHNAQDALVREVKGSQEEQGVCRRLARTLRGALLYEVAAMEDSNAAFQRCEV
jgi:hypothetical protein